MMKLISKWCDLFVSKLMLRLVMLAVVLFYAAITMAGGGGSPTYYYAKFTAKVSTTGGGKVYINTQQKEPDAGQYVTDQTQNTKTESVTQIVYLYAKSEPGYYFVDWKKDEVQYSTTEKGVYVDVEAGDSKNDESKRVDGGTYVASFVPVEVQSGANGSIQVSDIYVAENSLTTAHTATGKVTFSVTGADNIEDFYTPTIAEAAGFSYQKMEYANGVLSVTIQYQDQNMDNVNPGSNPTLQTTVTLRSKGDTDGSKTQSAVVSAYSSLKPDFTINPSEGKSFIDLTPNTPMSNDATLTASFAKVLDGAASTPTAINVSPKNNVANAGQWSISFKDAADAANKGFSISGQQVSFKPTEAYKNKVDISTVLCVQCTYTDINGKEISKIEEITISADAGGIITIQNEEDGLMLTNATMVFDVDFGTSGDFVTKTLAFMTTLPDVTQAFSAGFPAEYITSTLQDGDTKLSISIKNTLPIGQHNHTITFTSSGVSATLNLIVNVRLAKPILTATTGIGQAIQLDWQDIDGATSYILKNGTTQIAAFPLGTTTYTMEHYNGQTLSTMLEFNFTVTAVYEPNPFGTRISDEVKVQPSMPASLTQGTISGLKIYTGTDQSGEFPYKAKQLVDLQHTFDTEGNALFDELYIFGLTTNTSGGTALNTPNESTPCNAQTPCYMYVKNASGKSYDLSQEFDAATTRFDHGTSKNDKKLYFTGYCPFAHMGTNMTHEGWMYFRGGNARVDLYLENCDVRGRYKTPTGINSGYSDRLNIGLGDNFITGANSIFVFNSTNANENQPFKPHIHISGNNHLKGQGGVIASVWLYVTVLGFELYNEQYLTNVQYASAPISVKPDSENGFTDLTMDDVWPAANGTNEITNGSLRLDCYSIYGEKFERAPCVDLGSQYGSLTINGGQYLLRNAASDFNYTNNLAVSYRKYAGGIGGSDLAYLYGFGGDMGDSKIVINSGTFTMYRNVYESGGVINGAVYYLDQDEFCDLRLPIGNGKSQINGGTFNGISNVLFVSEVMSSGKSPVNAADLWLCLQDVTVTGTNSYGGAEFKIPSPFVDAYSNENPIYDVSSSENLNKVTVPEDLLLRYGAQSLNAVDGKVRLLLPGDACDGDCVDCEKIDEARYYNWATLAPEITLTFNSNSTPVGGPTEVPFTAEDAVIKSRVNNLVYADLVGLEGYEVGLSAGSSVKLANSYVRGQATNQDAYSVQKNLNIVKTVEADTWYTFVAPFDIHDLTVLEIGEDLTQYQNDLDPNNRNTAKKKQAEYNLRIWETLYYAIFPSSDGRATSRTLPQILRDFSALYPLQHYDGTNITTAHYYLYQVAKPIQEDQTGENLNIEWTPVPPVPQDSALMKKGQTYAIQFPYCPMCNDLATRTYYDYWTNKYIVFHGVGPQDVNGTNYHTTILNTTNPASGTAILTGNSTLTDYTLPSGYVHDMTVTSPTYDFFTHQTDATIKPTQGYMLYTPSVAKMPAHISRSGQIVYAEGEATDLGGVPTIGDRSTLMLFGAMDGFELLSLSDQLVTVYNLQGHIIFQQYMTASEQLYVATGAGIFVVRGESEAIKVIVE